MINFPELNPAIAVISNKSEGSIRTLDEKRRFVDFLGFKEKKLITPLLEHGTKVEVAGESVTTCDGVVTDNPNLILTVTVADCLPLFLFDPEKKAIGLIHAGWRGIVNGIAENGITLFKEEFNSDPKEIKVLIGPGICHHHFDIGPEIADSFKEKTKLNNGRIFVNLKSEAKNRLLSSGLLLKNITIHPGCTFCSSKKYFSYRRDKPKNIETMLSVLTLN